MRSSLLLRIAFGRRRRLAAGERRGSPSLLGDRPHRRRRDSAARPGAARGDGAAAGAGAGGARAGEGAAIVNRRETEGKDTAEAPVIDRLAAALGRDLDPSLVASPGSISLVDGRCRELGIDRARFTELVARDRLEAARLRRQIVPPETWLFRYPASFEHLRREAASRSNSAPMRVASLGCATGAEPFSIAAALDGVVEFEIVALDRDASSLEIARSATLGLGSVRSEIPSWACGSLSVREHAVVMPAKWLDRIR
ncbi:MAG: hypothetical protein FJ253_10200, partial [Phycisphaerae bacterium]|nr:hypothetical protein [Phycisphaerae bacterium]